MSNLVIVAIPDENDRAWQVSSEKVPHLTVLFLGDSDNVSNLEQIVGFVEHAANQTLRRFYLPVDRRGELGEDQADVLFFKKGRYDYKAIRDFRAALLQDTNIKRAYDSSTQFDGVWQPHLTLGYPATPAKKIPNDQGFPFYEVSFNKIGVWIEDYDGPDFLLKDYWDEWEAMETVPMDVPMSALSHAVKVSDTPWSNFKDSDYDDSQYARACLLDRGEDAGTAKQRYGLPVREPDGTLNRNACHAAAAVLSSKGGTGSARGSKVKGSPEQIAAAKKKLITLYNGPLGEDVPEGLGGEAKQAIDMGAEYILEHYGVKGMRWGVRKSDVGSAARSVGKAAKSAGGKVGKAAAATARFAGDVSFENQAEDGRAREAIVNKSYMPYKKQDLPAVKARHGDYAKLTNRVKKPFSKEAKAYRKDARETYVKRLETTANSMKNVSGDRQYTIRERGFDQPAEGGALPRSKNFWDVTTRRVKHAVTDAFTRLEVIMDDEGYITDLKQVEIEDEMAQTADLGAEFLAHYGVKGMKWGTRKESVEGSTLRGSFRSIGAFRKHAPGVLSRRSEIRLGLFGGLALFDSKIRAEVKAADRQVILSKADKKWEKGLNNGSAWVAVNNASADHFNKHIDSVNNKYPKDRDWSNEDYANPTSPDFKRYMKDINSLTQDSIKHATNELNLMNPSGSKKVKIESGGLPGDYRLSVEEVKHADNDDSVIQIKVDFQFDKLGRVTGFTYSDEPQSMAQSIELGEAFILEHYGVKGMRWGHRRSLPQAVTPMARSRVPHGTRRKTQIKTEGGENQPASDDAIKVAQSRAKLKRSGTAALSNQELRDVANRLQLEAQVATLSTSRGQKFVMRELETGSQQLVKRGVKSGAKNVTKKKLKKGAATLAVSALL